LAKRVAVSDVYLIEEVVDSEEYSCAIPYWPPSSAPSLRGSARSTTARSAKGVIFIVIQLVNGALTGVLIGWILLPIVGLWVMIDAYMTAKRNNERYSFR
jgi:hypothetical protein